MADRKLESLRSLPLFAHCSKTELESIAVNTDEVDLPAGRLLFEEGKPNHTFFLILEGEVDVQVHGKQADRLFPGQFFGEMSMIDAGPASATVSTATPVKALVMSHAQFHNAIRSNDGIALQVLAVMAQRLRRLGLVHG